MSHSATATVTRRFHGVQDGHVYPRWFEVGETITGDLAAAMISSGDALDPSAEPVGPPLPVGNAVHAAAPLGVVTAPPGPDHSSGAGQGSGDTPSEHQANSAGTGETGNDTPPHEALEPKHVGRGVWWLVRGDERVKGPFDSKDDAVAALEEKGA